MDNTMKETRELRDKLSSLIDQCNGRRTAAEANLKDLESQFITELAAHALGAITNGELKSTRAGLALLRRELDEIPLTIQGLEARKEEVEPLLKELQKVWLKEDATEQFEALKKEIQEKGYSKRRYGLLKTFAHQLRREKEVEQLLEESREAWENAPLAVRCQV